MIDRTTMLTPEWPAGSHQDGWRTKRSLELAIPTYFFSSRCDAADSVGRAHHFREPCVTEIQARGQND
jgi:hypothetical protein